MWVLTRNIFFANLTESRYITGVERILSSKLTVCTFLENVLIIIVYNNLYRTFIPLTRHIHHRTGILKHWHKKRHYYRPCKQVLGRAIQAGALPHPFILHIIKISAVTRPNCQVRLLKTTTNVIRSRHIADPLIATIRNSIPQTQSINMSGIHTWDESAQFNIMTIDAYFVITIRERQTI